MTNNENDYGCFTDLTFTVDGKEMNVKQFCSMMNQHITSDDPREFLPVLGGLDRRNSIVLVELTSIGALSPSYNAYGFMLLKSLTKNKEQMHQLYRNGTELLAETHGEKIVINEEEIKKTIEDAFKKHFGLDINAKPSKPAKETTKKNNKKKNNNNNN